MQNESGQVKKILKHNKVKSDIQYYFWMSPTTWKHEANV